MPRSNFPTLLLLLPALALALAAPAAAEDDLYATAPARIEKHRKADAVVTVVDAAGRPVPNARVTVEQTRHAFLFGCNIFQWGELEKENPADEAAYRDRFAALFNFATLPYYWASYEPRPGETRHDRNAAIAAWCRDHGITAKGHPLAWNYVDPRWLPADPAEVLRLQYARIDSLVREFRGSVDVWDVVNEATAYERPEFRRRAPHLTAAWDSAGRVPFIAEALKHARAANPGATLLVNDYRTDPPYAAILQELVDGHGGKPPFDAIGIQSHMHGGAWSDRKVWDTCERFARFGVPLHFTETTILSGEPPRGRGENDRRPWPSTPEGEARQADQVERFYTLVFSHPATAALTWWDFADRHAWQGAPAGFLRQDLSPKPVYDRLLKKIKSDWWTRAEATADVQGVAPFRGFLGDYRVRVETPERQAEVAFRLTREGPNRLTVTLP